MRTITLHLRTIDLRVLSCLVVVGQPDILLTAGPVDHGGVVDVVSRHFPGWKPVTSGEADVVTVGFPLLHCNLVFVHGDCGARLPPEVPEPAI